LADGCAEDWRVIHLARDRPPDAREHDEVLDVLEAVVEALEQNSLRNEVAARRAGDIRRLRAEGRSYREIFATEDPPLILDLIRANLQSLLDVGSRLRRVEARALHEQGMTMEQIADLFGVTRQRVSALLREVR
jgi:hypothetical protein